MVILQKKMLRDLWVQKTSFLAIFLLMGMGCYIFAGITSEYHGMQVSVDTFMEETKMADAMILSKEPLTLDKDLQTQKVMKLTAQLPSQEQTTLSINVIQENKISQMKVLEGEAYTPETDGIWLDERFAKAHHINVQDTFTYQLQDSYLSATVKGLVLSPDYIYQLQDNQMLSDHTTSGYLYVNASSFPIAFQPNCILVKSDRSDLKKVLQEDIASTHSQLIMKEDNPSYSMIHDEITQHKEIGMIFSLTFLGIAVLVSITTIHRMLQTQQQQIGILKALGFHRKRLYVHYCSHCAWMTFVASSLGCVLGVLTFSAITYPFMSEMYTLPELNSVPIAFTFLLPILTTLVSIFISLRICHRYLQKTAATILYQRSQQTLNYHPSPRLFRHTSFITQWNIRDILRNRLRSFMSCFGVFGCTALLIGAFGIYTTIVNLSDWTFQKVETYECKVSGQFDDAVTKQLLNEMQGDELMSSIAVIKTEDGEEQISFTAQSDTRYARLATDQNTFVELHDGIALSKNIADTYGLQQGDTLHWKLIGSETWQHSTIEVILRTPLTQGMTMMKDTVEQHGLRFTPTSIVGNKPTAATLDNSQISNIQYHDDLVHNIDSMMDATVMMIVVFSFAAILLGSVILYNLGSLSYMERYYELATLKVLGFQTKSIRKILIQQNLWFSIAGILAGIPGGYWLLHFMLTTIQDAMDVILYLPIPIVLGSCLGTMMLSVLIISIISRKIKTIDMVSALKANE